MRSNSGRKQPARNLSCAPVEFCLNNRYLIDAAGEKETIARPIHPINTYHITAIVDSTWRGAGDT